MIIKWLHNRKHKHTPMCVCGYKMVFDKETSDFDRIYWKCKKCLTEAYENYDCKLHWFKKKS